MAICIAEMSFVQYINEAYTGLMVILYMPKTNKKPNPES